MAPFFVTWCNYRSWFCVRKALFTMILPRSRKRNHFQTLATGVLKLKTLLGTQRVNSEKIAGLSVVDCTWKSAGNQRVGMCKSIYALPVCQTMIVFKSWQDTGAKGRWSVTGSFSLMRSSSAWWSHKRDTVCNGLPSLRPRVLSWTSSASQALGKKAITFFAARFAESSLRGELACGLMIEVLHCSCRWLNRKSSAFPSAGFVRRLKSLHWKVRLSPRSYSIWKLITRQGRHSGQSVMASDFGSNGPRFESGRGRCVESLDKALYSHCPKEKPSH